MDDNLIYLLAAYAVFWAGTFVFLFSLRARQRTLEREVEALRTLLKQQEE